MSLNFFAIILFDFYSNAIQKSLKHILKMSPLDLDKDTETVPSEITEITETIEKTETTEIPVIVSESVEQTVNETNLTSLETTFEAQPEKIKSKPDYNESTKAELVDTLKVLVDREVEAVKDDVEIIKQVFYKKVKIEVEELKKAFLEGGGEELDFLAPKNEFEDRFKLLLNEFRIKKAALMAKLEKDRENNLLQKQHILSQMKALGDSNDDVSAHISEFRALQQKWKTIGQVPASASTELWKQYNLYQESFWDLIKINNELREYDFKKNLELKNALCETAEKLAQEENIVSAFQKLQKLHEEWHDLGPVARDLRESIWNRFKEASTILHKKHQSYFDEIRKQEEENNETKNALCDALEAFDFSELTNYKGWDEATKKVLNLQAAWRSTGQAPRKVNQKLFDRYRKACDLFFSAKAEFFRESKNTLVENAEKKRALCEKAEELKESTEWKETSSKLIQLQKEWKVIGSTTKKESDELWKRFITACDYFFEQKAKGTSGQKGSEAENLEKKKELIDKIQTFELNDNPKESLAALRVIMAEWNATGHVPFKEKDSIYKKYREALDKQFEVLNIDASERRIDSFKNNLKDMTAKGENKLYREREKLMRSYEHLKSEIATYENNIGFLSSSSKKGGGLIKEMERKIETLKEESKLIEQKINLIDENIE